jgi:hypothetical protein
MNNFDNIKTSTQSEGEFTKYYGCGVFKPLMVNPTASDLGTFLNKKIENEPQYLTNKFVDGKEVKSLRIDVWGTIESVEVKTKITFWLEGRHDVSRSGNFKMINGQGLTTYNIDTINKNKTWYYTENARKAVVGEEQVMAFIIKLMNIENRLEKYSLVDGDTPNFLLPLEQFFKGDVSIIQNMINKGNEIKAYFGITPREIDGKTYYDMVAYNKEFAYAKAKTPTPIINALKGEYSSFTKNIAPISETLEVFDPNTIKATATSGQSGTTASFSDDLPF